MTSATSSIFIIAGAVLAFTVSYSADSIYIQSVGAVAIVVGGLGLAAAYLKPAVLPPHAHHTKPGGQHPPVSRRQRRLQGPRTGQQINSTLSLGEQTL
jgi:hypothetical protein